MGEIALNIKNDLNSIFVFGAQIQLGSNLKKNYSKVKYPQYIFKKKSD